MTLALGRPQDYFTNQNILSASEFYNGAQSQYQIPEFSSDILSPNQLMLHLNQQEQAYHAQFASALNQNFFRNVHQPGPDPFHSRGIFQGGSVVQMAPSSEFRRPQSSNNFNNNVSVVQSDPNLVSPVLLV
jgi:hypothetical protein